MLLKSALLNYVQTHFHLTTCFLQFRFLRAVIVYLGSMHCFSILYGIDYLRSCDFCSIDDLLGKLTQTHGLQELSVLAIPVSAEFFSSFVVAIAKVA